ncbi:ubiquitin thioesterase OTU1-like [Macrosteles quadrilineatus]|uniref:ubiquitin thioesterase OTU1-like n=1 Tax=Macrosteles quadrilineatus TaxID=74068 RepID=UPI0023E1176E|nr:ubiquitin thioesterase OTU1-like [Macrosteles quadrilineatus]
MTGFILHVVVSKNRNHVIETLQPHSSVGLLKSELSKLAEIPVNNLYILSGNPLVRLELDDDQTTLQSNNICSGDRLIVLKKDLRSSLKENYDENNLYQDQKKPVLKRKIVPPDNSCLFTSIRFALMGELDLNCSDPMRQIIAEVVENDPETFNEGILGRPNAEYCQWILKPTSWGGGIELAILSKFYTIEIVVLDTVNGILNRFGEDQSYNYRIFLYFSGIHYDPLYLADSQGSSRKPKTLFNISDENILRQAEILAREARNFQFSECSDEQKFSIQCRECGTYLSGAREGGAHIRQTGHKSFIDVNYMV